MIDRRLAACAIASALGHAVLARALDELPARDPVPARRATIEIRVVEPPAAPPPPPAPAPREPEPTPAPRPTPVRRATRPAVQAAATARAEAPAVAASPAADPTATPVFGATMESTSQAGRTSVPVGNTPAPTAPGRGSAAPRPLGVAAAADVTKMPMPQGRCAGTYTDAARAAGIEGTVVLDLVVDASGRARDIQVSEGLGHGLTEAAIAALRACRFSPGEKDGVAVPVRIRGFKIRFVLQEGS